MCPGPRGPGTLGPIAWPTVLYTREGTVEVVSQRREEVIERPGSRVSPPGGPGTGCASAIPLPPAHCPMVSAVAALGPTGGDCPRPCYTVAGSPFEETISCLSGAILAAIWAMTSDLIKARPLARLLLGRPGGLDRTARPVECTANGIVSSSGGVNVCVARGGLWAGIASFGRSCPSPPAPGHPIPEVILAMKILSFKARNLHWRSHPH